MRITLAVVAVSIIAAFGATALLSGTAAAHAGRHHAAPAHRKHRRHRRTPRPPLAMRRLGGGTLHDPVWGHQGTLLTLRPGGSLALRPSGSFRRDIPVPPGPPGGDPEDPIQSECWDANAYIANTAPLPNPNPDTGEWGYIANWYSPDCGTNWAEAVLTNDPGFTGEALEADIYDETTGENYMFASTSNGTYTDMTQSATTTACATGGLLVPADRTGYEGGTACA